ncbi:MAG: PAS domain-containing protein [Anaerolineaceae bacterium]|nr:PAS domain-containing protein [Anaerolineaceae bacterium]
MYWQFNPYVILILLGLVPLVYFAYRANQYRSTLAARLFIACALASVWTFLVYILELLSADPTSLLLWVRMRFIFSIFVPPLGLLFILAYVGMDEWVTWRNFLLLSILPVVRLFAVMTNDSFHLQWVSYDTVRVGSLLFSRYQDATGSAVYWMGQLYFLVVVAIMIGVIRAAMVRSPGLLRGQIFYVLVAILLPTGGIVLEVIGIHPIPNLNLPVFTLCLAAVPLGLALFRYRLLDIVPAAQSLVLQSMQDAVMVLDLQSRIVQANPAAIALRSSHTEGIVGRTAEDVFSDLPHLVERFDKVFDAQEILEVKGEEHTSRYFDLRISPLRNADKDISGRILVLRDVTAAKRAEEHALDLALERERTHLLKSFISDTSHDIMTPISAMRISTYLLRTLTDKISHATAEAKSNPESAVEALSMLETTVNAMREKSTNLDASALRLQTLVEGMLEMVKLDKQVFAFKSCDLNILAEQAVNLQRFLAEDKGIQLQLYLESDLPKVALDSNQFIRVIQNLLTNALKYTPKGGTVTVHTKQYGEDVALEIHDTGEGIPAADLPHIFDRMYRVDKTRTTDKSGVGLGLGLAIVKTIVTAHHGTIEVESKIGQGSTFRVIVPAIESNGQPDLPSTLHIA